MENLICRVCGIALALDSDVVTIGSLGQCRLRRCSELRGDGLFTIEEDNLMLHNKCRKKYIHENCVQAAYKKRLNIGNKCLSKEPIERKFATDDLLSLPSKARIIKKICEPVSNVEFDFQKHCLFCKQDASSNFIEREKKKPSNKRNMVRSVARDHTKERILCASYDCNDEWSKEVRKTIRQIDIVLLKAKYHKNCYTKFIQRRNSLNTKKGRPRCEIINDQMVHVFDYIDNMDAAQFTFQEIQNAFEVDLPCVRTFNTRLIEHYGNDLSMINGLGKTTVYCLVNRQKNDTESTEQVGEQFEDIKPAANMIVETDYNLGTTRIEDF